MRGSAPSTLKHRDTLGAPYSVPHTWGFWGAGGSQQAGGVLQRGLGMWLVPTECPQPLTCPFSSANSHQGGETPSAANWIPWLGHQDGARRAWETPKTELPGDPRDSVPLSQHPRHLSPVPPSLKLTNTGQRALAVAPLAPRRPAGPPSP